MLIGGSDHNVDKKGRVFIPARFKADFGENMVICACVFGNKCLWGFTEEGFERFCNKLNKFSYDQTQEMYRVLSDGAAFADFDASGRVLIPSELRSFADIESSVHIVGMKNYIEIWSSELWEETKSKVDMSSFAPMVKEMNFSFGD
ncbi:MAG: cell division/cell wall cluster transcriptional repressor MraZ [Clostridia bacterium]|nr:cell division/cell wall cluster transcriptional repressor MraZ [Clostridia bacterium]